MYWWTSLVREIRLSNSPQVEYWNDLKSALRRRHIPSYYNRELMDKLQRLQQKNMSVEKYRRKIELYMMRTWIKEGEETTISRFFSGLNADIRDRVELLLYQDLNDLVHICIKVEQQHLRKGLKDNHSNSYVKRDYKRGGKQMKREEPSRKFAKEKEKPKEGSSSFMRTSEIKCFKCQGRSHISSQCPSKRTIILRVLMHIIVKKRKRKAQERMRVREKIPTLVREISSWWEEFLKINKTCSLIMDSGSCYNFCSTRLVEKLGLQSNPIQNLTNFNDLMKEGIWMWPTSGGQALYRELWG